MPKWILEFDWDDYKKYNGAETTAPNENSALRNVLFSELKGRRTEAEIVALYEKMLVNDAFSAYDITDIRSGTEPRTFKEKEEKEDPNQMSLFACIDKVKKALVASQLSQDIAQEQCGLPVDRELQISINEKQVDRKHPQFWNQQVEKEPDY
jgi:hypothetical protein